MAQWLNRDSASMLDRNSLTGGIARSRPRQMGAPDACACGDSQRAVREHHLWLRPAGYKHPMRDGDNRRQERLGNR